MVNKEVRCIGLFYNDQEEDNESLIGLNNSTQTDEEDNEYIEIDDDYDIDLW